eukprot:6199310-Pleurochrysis_carterae.AAC.1
MGAVFCTPRAEKVAPCLPSPEKAPIAKLPASEKDTDQIGPKENSVNPVGASKLVACIAESQPNNGDVAAASINGEQTNCKASTRGFIKAVKAGRLDEVQSLLDSGVDIEHRSMWENTPLLVACHYAHSAVALELLGRGANASAVNELGCTPLLYACNEHLAE